MVPANGGHTSMMPSGPQAERISQIAVPRRCPNIQESTLTYPLDLYLATIVTAMFLAGCVLVILNARQR
jgi:hypothetical protein